MHPGATSNSTRLFPLSSAFPFASAFPLALAKKKKGRTNSRTAARGPKVQICCGQSRKNV